MDVTAVNLAPTPATGAEAKDAALRRAALEFEALLLSQLTGALNQAEEEEEGLFSSNATGLYRQMFSEQLATTMAKSGGIGLADTILHQIGMKNFKQGAHGLRLAVEAARAVRAPGAEIKTAEIKATATPTPATLNPHAAGDEPVPIHLPLHGRISSNFGDRRDPLHGRHRHHGGTDIAAPRGTPIAAAAAGKVVFAGRRGGYGKLVEIEHADGRRTRYAHTESLLVKVGDQVLDGQVIATVGSTGRSTGPHLHFEVTEDGARVDPLRAVAKDFLLARR